MVTIANEIPDLDRKGLREFGLTMGGIFAALFGLLLPWLFETDFPLWPWILAAVLVAWALASPLTMRPLYRTWMRLALVIQKITTPIVLGLVFFLVFTPVALVMRIIGRDSMARSFDADSASYRVHSVLSPKDKMEKPF
jgi:hypothetical protein